MSAIRDSLVQYVAVRRALGTKFYEPALALGHFVDLLEREGGSRVHHQRSGPALGDGIQAGRTCHMGPSPIPSAGLRQVA